MGLRLFSKVCILIGASALLVNCSGSSSSSNATPNAPNNNSQNACSSFAVPCTISNGSGTASCTDSNSGPVYGTCENIVCDPGFHMNSDSVCVSGENVKNLTMLVTGPSLAPQGVSSFIALIGETYDFKITGTQNVVNAGLNASQSYAKYISGQCAGIGYTYQPLTTNFAVSGSTPQFGDNNVTYTATIADTIGGCIWQLCVVSNDTTVAPSCVNMIASTNPLAPSPTTTTVPSPTTTTVPAPTTTLAPVTTTTSTLPAPTTTLPAPTTSTTTTTLPHPPPTTTTSTTTSTSTTTTSTTTSTTTTSTTTSTTTTTLPAEVPKIVGNTCAGAGSGQYNCMPFTQSSGTGANNLKRDIGCTTNVTITYKGKTVTTSLFGNAAPYYQNGQGIGTSNKSVVVQGVTFQIYLTDAYSLSMGLGWVDCNSLISWPNYPHAP